MQGSGLGPTLYVVMETESDFTPFLVGSIYSSNLRMTRICLFLKAQIFKL